MKGTKENRGNQANLRKPQEDIAPPFASRGSPASGGAGVRRAGRRTWQDSLDHPLRNDPSDWFACAVDKAIPAGRGRPRVVGFVGNKESGLHQYLTATAC
jgi:hypothetical protein